MHASERKERGKTLLHLHGAYTVEPSGIIRPLRIAEIGGTFDESIGAYRGPRWIGKVGSCLPGAHTGNLNAGNIMLQALAVIILGAVCLLIFFASNEKSTKAWRRCVKCSMWFGRDGKRVAELPWVARFAIHADGECPTCSKERTDEIEPDQVSSFSA